eukprot:scaffold19768_cov128-Isochrysis_galbana.AAC.3
MAWSKRWGVRARKKCSRRAPTRSHLDVEAVEFEGRADHPSDKLGDRIEAHRHPRLVNHTPQRRVPLRVWVRVAVRHNIELAVYSGSLVQRSLGDDEPVRVVVDVSEADPVLAIAENAQPAGATRLQQVGKEQVISRAVHLVRGHGAGEQAFVRCRCDGELRHGLGLRIELKVALLRSRAATCGA